MTFPRFTSLTVSSAVLSAVHICALPALGEGNTIRGWGLNTSGQVTIPVETRRLPQVAAGDAFSLVRRADGSVGAWGDNSLLQTTVPKGVLGAVWIAAGGSHGLAALDDGIVICWGDNSMLQCDVPFDLVTAVTVAGGSLHSMALTSAGSVRCWGSNDAGQCTLPLGLGITEEIAAGASHSMARKSDGSVTCWGLNDDGQATVPLDLGATIAISGGGAHSVAINSLGEVRCWGRNASGQCSTPPGLVDVIAVAAGGSHTVALERAGTVVCWGDNADTQSTVPVDLEPVTQIAAGGSHTLAIEAAGADCDKDNIRDEIEIRDDPGLDCNSDGVLDSCIAAEFTDESVEVSPFGSGDTITLSIIDSPRPMLPVQIEIEIRADLGSSIEYLVLSLNDVDIDYIFNAGGKDCPTTSQFCKLSYPAADYIALLTDNGDAVFELRASSFVSTVECPNSFATLAVNFETDSADCNGNGLPDMCELLSGDVPDVDGDGVPDTCQGTVKGDHNRDGIADLTFFNPSTRRIVFSYLDGTTVSESLPAIDAVGNGWLPIAQADLDGDGESDFILRNATTRQTYGWLMDGTAIASSAEIGYALPTNVQFLTMADVDGDDDDDDIVWIDNTDKKIYAWRLAGTVLVGGGLIGNSTGTVFAGAGDIDADGDDDFMFRNTTSGFTFCWVIQDGSLSEYTQAAGGATLGSEYQGRGMADANGDGTDDLFWRNSTTGALYCWYMDGTDQIGGGLVGYNPGRGVDVAALEDIDGDGTTDLLWKDVSGQTVYGWILDGIEFDSGGIVRSLPEGSTVFAP